MMLAVVVALAATAQANAASLEVSIARNVGTPAAPAATGLNLKLRTNPLVAAAARTAPLVVELPPEVRVGRPGAEGCTAEDVAVDGYRLCHGWYAGSGDLVLWTAQGVISLTFPLFVAPGGQGANGMAMGSLNWPAATRTMRELLPVTFESDGSRLIVDWRHVAEFASSWSEAAVAELVLRLRGPASVVTTTGCTDAWRVRALVAGDLPAEMQVPCRIAPASDTGPCAEQPEGVKCQLGGGRRTPGGKLYGKVSHKGWPAITGLLLIADHAGRELVGAELNDELLGGHGSDDIVGGEGDDVLWADMWPTGNNSWQRDRVVGGPGDDFLYASHGRNVVDGGDGRDIIWAYFVHGVNRIDAGPGNDEVWEHSGSGVIDCGPGRDIVHTRVGAPFRLRGCEVVRHYCAFGPNGHGGCLRPGQRGARRVPHHVAVGQPKLHP